MGEVDRGWPEVGGVEVGWGRQIHKKIIRRGAIERCCSPSDYFLFALILTFGQQINKKINRGPTKRRPKQQAK